MAKEPTLKEKLEIQKLELEIKNSSTKVRLDYFNSFISVLNLGALVVAGWIGYNYIQSRQVGFTERSLLIQEAAHIISINKDKSIDEKIEIFGKNKSNPYLIDETSYLQSSQKNNLKIEENELKFKAIENTIGKKASQTDLQDIRAVAAIEIIKEFCRDSKINIDYKRVKLEETRKQYFAEAYGIKNYNTSGQVGFGVKSDFLRKQLMDLDIEIKDLLQKYEQYCLSMIEKLK